MAEWYAEGFLQKVLDRYDPQSRQLLEQVRTWAKRASADAQ